MNGLNRLRGKFWNLATALVTFHLSVGDFSPDDILSFRSSSAGVNNKWKCIFSFPTYFHRKTFLQGRILKQTGRSSFQSHNLISGHRIGTSSLLYTVKWMAHLAAICMIRRLSLNVTRSRIFLRNISPPNIR